MNVRWKQYDYSHVVCVNKFSYYVITYKGDSQKTKFIYKKLCIIYSYTCKLQSPSKYSPFDAMHLTRHIFHCSKQFLNLWILVLFSASDIFCCISFRSAKHFPSRTFFILGNKKKFFRSRSSEQGGWSTRVMPFLVKNC